jgi:hypothetical protein
MDTPEWRKRLARDGRGKAATLAPGYQAAQHTLDDQTWNETNPYWASGNDGGWCAIPGDRLVFDEMGGEYLPEDIRALAYELLVLADLAELDL